MTKETAQQIAELINRRNGLSAKYTSDKVLSDKDNYVVILDGNELVACVESKKVRWYQCEICHVSVNEKFKGQGKGPEILALAEDKAKKQGARIIQCTIRDDNRKSIRLFSANGYENVNRFYNAVTRNTVLVFQKRLYDSTDK